MKRNPFASQPLESVVETPPAPAQQLAVASKIRRPLRPGKMIIAPLPPRPDLIPGVNRDDDGKLIPFAAAAAVPPADPWWKGLTLPAPKVTPDEIDQLCVGVTKETAAAVLAKLREFGVIIPKSGIQDAWGLWSTELCLLGLCEPSPLWFGAVNIPRANSDHWSRNHKFEEARCAPPF
jgi:hypothetical protein